MEEQVKWALACDKCKRYVEFFDRWHGPRYDYHAQVVCEFNEFVREHQHVTTTFGTRHKPLSVYRKDELPCGYGQQIGMWFTPASATEESDEVSEFADPFMLAPVLEARRDDVTVPLSREELLKAIGKPITLKPGAEYRQFDVSVTAPRLACYGPYDLVDGEGNVVGRSDEILQILAAPVEHGLMQGGVPEAAKKLAEAGIRVRREGPFVYVNEKCFDCSDLAGIQRAIEEAKMAAEAGFVDSADKLPPVSEEDANYWLHRHIEHVIESLAVAARAPAKPEITRATVRKAIKEHAKRLGRPPEVLFVPYAVADAIGSGDDPRPRQIEGVTAIYGADTFKVGELEYADLAGTDAGEHAI